LPILHPYQTFHANTFLPRAALSAALLSCAVLPSSGLDVQSRKSDHGNRGDPGSISPGLAYPAMPQIKVIFDKKNHRDASLFEKLFYF
jgi:hypothetical protein